MAAQAGVISMISAPAFVAIRPGGGLTWLQYEFALPLAMILLTMVLIPRFYRSEVITIYEYLERRFDVRTRLLFSLAFQISRGLATGVSIYAVRFHRDHPHICRSSSPPRLLRFCVNVHIANGCR